MIPPDNSKHSPLNLGDWVTSYSPGIWQIYRIVPIVNEMRFSLADRRRKSRRVLIFSKRSLNEQWVPDFASECCSRSLVSTPTAEDRQRLQQMLIDNPTLLQAFDQYQPAAIDLIGNLSMRVPVFHRLEAFCTNVLAPAMTPGVSMEQILQLMKAEDLEAFLNKYPINATLQVVSRDHEMKDGAFIFRACRAFTE
jgi:hypothetical protein